MNWSLSDTLIQKENVLLLPLLLLILSLLYIDVLTPRKELASITEDREQNFKKKKKKAA